MCVGVVILGLRGYVIDNTFIPDTADYDAYGIKIALNDILFVEARGKSESFLVQYAPYNHTVHSLQCSIDYDDNAHYVYSVGVGIKQKTNTNISFYFAGEVVPRGSASANSSAYKGNYIGVWINRDPQSVPSYVTTQNPFSCDYFKVESLEFISSYEHQEFFIIAIEPYGQYAIGIATDFIFKYEPFPVSTIRSKSTVDVWPNNVTFFPCATDASELFTIVAGFVEHSAQSRVRATPTVYVISNNNLTVLSSWFYSATNSSWQSYLTYSGVDAWNKKYTMSVNINVDDPTRILIGMPFLNTVFLFILSNNGTTLTWVSSIYNGRSVGYGKSVTWLTGSQAAILVSTYSFDHSTWYASQIYLYTFVNDTNQIISPTAIIPNAQQPLPTTINPKLIQIVSSPASLAILDTDGGVLLIVPTEPGYYSSSDIRKSAIAAAMPIVSHSTKCIGGTFKNDTGIHPCVLCPSGSHNTGQEPGLSCLNCSSNSFCPLGAVYEIESTILMSRSQAYAFPRSPEMELYEDILLTNIFLIGSTAHCVRVSPIFWSFMIAIFASICIIFVASLHRFIHPEKGEKCRNTLKAIFRRTDLVGEGEMWIGGIASLILVAIACMAYGFAISYLNQYPSEKVGPSSFACDTTIRNAKYWSQLQALAVAVSDEEEPIFDMLDEQDFTLYLELINTAADCSQFSIEQVDDSSTIELSLLSCSNMNGTLSASVMLTDHELTISAVLSDIPLIGGIQLGLRGNGLQNGLYTLQDVDFRKTFYSQSNQTLAQKVTIKISITKVRENKYVL
ncbi:unnamed protein product [Rotaria sp. Silwood2]|nr:unnamed protein product [Rotaria sp. Silwood2]